MTLSARKLEKLLDSKGFLIKRIYAMHGLIVYVEAMCASTADSFLLYIPSAYEIKVEDGDNVHRMKYVEVSQDGTLAENYAGEPDNFGMEEEYAQVDLANAKPTDENFEEQLHENYNHPLALKDVTKQDTEELRDIFRQLKRLRFCVAGIKYKIAILFRNYLCCIKRDDTLEGYRVSNLPKKDGRVMLVSIDLEAFYEKSNSLAVDVRTVREGIYRVMDKNQTKHSHNLRLMFDQRNDITAYSQAIATKKQHLATYIAHLDSLMDRLAEKEKQTIEQIVHIQDKHNTPSLSGLQSDISKSHEVSRFETQLTKISDIKQEIVQHLVDLRHRHEVLTLKVDKIFFETSIMLDAILKHMSALEILI